MSTIEKLPLGIEVNEHFYQLNVWPNAWGHLTVGYRTVARDKYYCCCTVEPYANKTRIKDTENTFNEFIGTMNSFDEACEEVLSFLNERALITLANK